MSRIQSALLVVLAIFICTVSTNAQRSRVADVPMLQRGLEPAVEIKINGQGPFLFAIDTGGGMQADLDPSVAAQLKLPTNGKVRAGDPSGRNGHDYDTVLVESLSFGGAEFRGITAMVREQRMAPNTARIDGILGFALFADYLLTLDYPGKRVLVERGELPQTNGSDIMAFRVEQHIPVIDLLVGSLKLNAHIDSGNMMGGFALPESAIGKLKLASEPVTVGRASSISNVFEIKEVRLAEAIKLGSFEFAQPKVTFPTVAEHANIGSAILQEFALTFDQKNERLKLKRTVLKSEPIPVVTASGTKDYSGRYGARSIFQLANDWYIQRDGGPRLKLVAAGKDEFTLAEVPEARIKFLRGADGKISELLVLNREGQWESAKKE
ncbi:MAG TPA: retropepsin-like aspartic protease [Pyrinomonadaceae bacterium]|nr:retropepsin-like aspartic protease [Pyrinomonadaceae bacterium]